MAEKIALKSEWGGTILRALTHFAERMKGLEGLNDLYRLCAPGGESGFFRRVLAALDLQVEESPELSKLPSSGPVIIVAAFPASPLDCLALMSALEERRPDTKVLAPKDLGWVPEARNRMIPLDRFRRGLGKNLSAIRASLAHLRHGGALVLFPWPGGFPALERGSSTGVWSRVVALLLRMSGAPVLPALVRGRNTQHGLEDPSEGARTLTLELGSLLSPERLASYEGEKALLDYLRLRAWLLRQRSGKSKRPPVETPDFSGKPIASPVGASLLQEELLSLKQGRRLLEAGDMEVWIARSQEIPLLMREIGRLRELSFRAAGEGTGKPVDLDSFDRDYLHLFLWQKEKQEVVGAYRLGQTDRILKSSGVNGLYTHSLLKLRRPLLEQLNPALELGRSFVRVEYQKTYAPLLLLWRGLAAFVAKHPRYKILFGAVSISNDYHPLSKELMVSYVKQHCTRWDLARLAKPRNPYGPGYHKAKVDQATWTLGLDLDEISDWVAELEGDGKGLPVLLRQYAKLGGSFIGFNVDPDFGNVVDGMILVDLTMTDEKILERTMGRDATREFLAWHRAKIKPQAMSGNF
jgi:putative hemolysin